MKKILLGVAFVVAAITVNAQNDAIGVRLGAGSDYGAEVSYQKGISDANRMQFDLGLNSRNDYFGAYLTGTYQWKWNLVDNLEWFVGPGAQVGFYNYNPAGTNNDKSGLGIGVGGIIGLDYTFSSVPIQLSLDTRPMWNLLGSTSYNFGLALGIRYVF